MSASRSLSLFPPMTPTLHRFVSRVLVITFPLQASCMRRNTELSSQITGIRRVDRVNSLFSSQETKERKIKSQRVAGIFCRVLQRQHIFSRNYQNFSEFFFLFHREVQNDMCVFFHGYIGCS